MGFGNELGFDTKKVVFGLCLFSHESLVARGKIWSYLVNRYCQELGFSKFSISVCFKNKCPTFFKFNISTCINIVIFNKPNINVIANWYTSPSSFGFLLGKTCAFLLFHIVLTPKDNAMMAFISHHVSTRIFVFWNSFF